MVLALLVVLVLAIPLQTTGRLVPEVSEGLHHGPRRPLSQSNVDKAQVSPAVLRNINDTYIVFFDESAGSADVAARSLVAEVATALAAQSNLPAVEAATASTAATSGQDAVDDIAIINVIGESSDAAAAAAPHAAAAAAATPGSTAAASGSRTTGIQAVLVKASRRALRHIKRSKLVRHVIQDREVASQQVLEAAQQLQAVTAEPQSKKRSIKQVICVEAIYISQGVSAAASTSLKWPGCRVAGSKLVWKGTTCGDGSKVKYTQLRAVNSQGKLIKPTCILKPDPTKAAWTRQRFGGCGVQPTFTTALPTSICSATGGGSSGGGSSGGDSSNPPSPSNNPLRSGPLLPRVPVVSGETVSSSMTRIEAATAAGVDNTDGLASNRQVAVAIIDSGIDGTHPDLNLAGGQSWATPSPTLTGDVANYDVDYYGHGTHVAGIVGARNSGQGYVGVVPNTPLYSLKILNGEGKGTLSSAMNAVSWTYSAAGVAAQIGVINLSLAAKLDPTSSTYKDDLASICSVFTAASNAGIVIAAAAGNYASDMTGYVPASCPTVVAVTSMGATSNAASGFSNFLPSSANASGKSMMMAAPGEDVPSTMSYKVDSSGYRSLSGTSMASPHIAGVAAACIMSGACSTGTTGASKIAMLQAAAQERLTMGVSANTPQYDFTVPNGNYYGNLVWSKW